MIQEATNYAISIRTTKLEISMRYKKSVLWITTVEWIKLIQKECIKILYKNTHLLFILFHCKCHILFPSIYHQPAFTYTLMVTSQISIVEINWANLLLANKVQLKDLPTLNTAENKQTYFLTPYLPPCVSFAHILRSLINL